MLVTARNSDQARTLLTFMAMRGVVLAETPDLRFIARVADNSTAAIRGIVAYNGFNGRTCAIHVAGVGRWIDREFLHEAFRYPFEICDMVQLWGMVAANNERALRLNSHLGFSEMHRIAGGWDADTDLVVMGMHRAECRWLIKRKSRYGKPSRDTISASL